MGKNSETVGEAKNFFSIRTCQTQICRLQCWFDVCVLTCAQVTKTQVWLDGTTHRNLKDALGSVILILWSQDVPPLWWHRLTERNLEKRFGRCRQFFPNSQMSVGDYWRSSARIMRQDVKSFDAKREEQLPAPQPLSKNDFQEIAVRSLKAAMR